MSTKSRHEVLVGLHVTDNDSYTSYRAAMTPILEAAGGWFRYDFTIDQMLKGSVSPAINRLFVISFPDEPTKDRFFSDPNYVSARTKFFEPAVDLVELIATYDHAGE
ncbi:MAG: hypothetical protein ACI82F_002882 [Planctomycetota bacterium]|jgi:uncharacterized protein (DUF1330 family)